MAKLESWTCDVCNTVKQPSNNWWKMFLVKSGQILSGIIVVRWDQVGISAPLKTDNNIFSPDAADGHVCGQNCLSKWISQKLFAVTPGRATGDGVVLEETPIS